MYIYVCICNIVVCEFYNYKEFIITAETENVLLG